MTTPFSQQPHSVLLIRPTCFGFNIQTSASNAFQVAADISRSAMQKLALTEFDQVVKELSSRNISCIVEEDTVYPEKPDAIFPNNWFSTHENGTVVLYPMLAENRRLERRKDIIQMLNKKYEVTKEIDLSPQEEGRILEGTGSIIFDHVNRLAYACRSPRTEESLLNELCDKLDYRSVFFDSVDEKGTPIYHTNVMMWVGEKVACLCLDSIIDEEDQERILLSFERTSHKVVAISYKQMEAFAGNMLELKDKDGARFLAMSNTAFNALIPDQLNEISKHAEPLPVSIPSIEKYGGGGIRCMLAGIHLPIRR